MFPIKFFITLILLQPTLLLAITTSLNVGYHNPPGSNIGANFLFSGEHLACELGVGWLDVSSSGKNDKDDSASFVVLGDADLKYLFGGSKFRPYIQGGFSSAISGGVGEVAGFGGSVGKPYFGLGFFIGRDVYFYGSGNLMDRDLFFQAGFGVSLR